MNRSSAFDEKFVHSLDILYGERDAIESISYIGHMNVFSILIFCCCGEVGDKSRALLCF